MPAELSVTLPYASPKRLSLVSHNLCLNCIKKDMYKLTMLNFWISVVVLKSASPLKWQKQLKRLPEIKVVPQVV